MRSQIVSAALFMGVQALPTTDSITARSVGSSIIGTSPNIAAVRWDGGINKDECSITEDFVNKTSDGSPNQGDCLAMAELFRRDRWGMAVMGRNEVIANSGPFDYHKIWSVGNCAFGIKTRNFNGARVGNTDIADLIYSSNEKFAWNGKLGAEGTVPCNSDSNQRNSDGERAKVYWAIYRA